MARDMINNSLLRVGRGTYVANTPSSSTFFTGGRDLICLAIDTCGKPQPVSPDVEHASGEKGVHKSMIWFLQIAQLSTTMSVFNRVRDRRLFHLQSIVGSAYPMPIVLRHSTMRYD